MTEEIIINEKSLQAVLKRCDELEQENEKLKKEVKQIGSDFIKKGDYARELEHYLAYMTEQRNKLKIALEKIGNYCDRIEQGSVIGTQDCLINSIKNITNEVLNA